MRKILALTMAIGTGAACLPVVAHAEVAKVTGNFTHGIASQAIHDVDYYWHNEHWRHRDWDRHRHEWRYHN